MKKLTRKSSRQSSRLEPAAVPSVSAGSSSAADTMRLKARGRTEADMIATALQDAPPLNRARMGVDLYPFNDIASSDVVQATVARIVRRRIPGSYWPDAHAALLKTDDNGKGYAEFMDAYRDVAFLVGVDYALRSLLAEFPFLEEYRSLKADGRALFAWMIRQQAADKGGAS